MKNSTTRRSAIMALAAAATSTTQRIASAEPKQTPATTAPDSQFAEHEILMLVFPQFTALDLIGPQHVFALLGPSYRTRLVWKNKDVLQSDTGIPIQPTMTFDECPRTPSIIFVPGGTDGTVAAIEDPDVRRFLSDVGSKANYVTSVCTGSLILGAAGLLKGYKATSHWLALRHLERFGATPVSERVVQDRNRITGAGVTAGIDFALTLASQLQNDDYAKSIQLMMEYDPKPPFDSGNPKAAPAASVQMLEAMTAPFHADVESAASRVKLQ